MLADIVKHGDVQTPDDVYTSLNDDDAHGRSSGCC